MNRAIVGLAVVGACLGVARVAECADTAAGQAIYLKKCATCHGKQGEGNEKMATMLKATIHPLSGKEVQGKSDDELSKDMIAGTGKMKPVKDLSEADAAEVVKHIRSLAK